MNVEKNFLCSYRFANWDAGEIPECQEPAPKQATEFKVLIWDPYHTHTYDELNSCINDAVQPKGVSSTASGSYYRTPHIDGSLSCHH